MAAELFQLAKDKEKNSEFMAHFHYKRRHQKKSTQPLQENLYESSISENSMNEICLEQNSRERKLQSSDVLVQALLHILGAQSGDPSLLVKLYHEMQHQVKALKDTVDDGYRSKDDMTVEFKQSTQSLRTYIWDGCTRQPNCWDRTVAALAHTLGQNMDTVDKKVLDASHLFTSVKNGDKQCFRNLWQWFLTDPARLLHALKNANCKIYS